MSDPLSEPTLSPHVPSSLSDTSPQAERPAGPAGLPVVSGFEVLRELGRGGMGVVYLARQTGLERLVALKVVLAGGHARPDELARFRAEALAAASLRHPHIVGVIDSGVCDLGGGPCPYLALELVEGGSLEDRLRQGPLPGREAAALVARLAHAVHHAHQRGVIHRDLKPANVLLSPPHPPSPPLPRGERGEPASLPLSPGWERGPGGEGDATPKLTDFGLARRLDADSRLTQSGAILGTPAYMAPEQASGSDPTTLVDVYGLGAILYECLTGQAPFTGRTPLDVLVEVTTHPPRPPRDFAAAVDRDLEVICLKCLEKDPGGRYASAAALAEDLERWLAGEPIAARPPRFLQLVRAALRHHFGAAGWLPVLGAAYGLLAALPMFYGAPLSFLQMQAGFYRQHFPSQDAPFGWLLSVPRLVWLYLPLLYGTLAVICTSGLIAVRLVRPRNRIAEAATGLIIGTTGALVLFVACGGWFFLLQGSWLRPALRDVDLLYESSQAKATAARDDPLLDAYPELREQPPARRAALVAAKLFYDSVRVAPLGFLVGLLYCLLMCEGVCVSLVLAAGRAWRRGGGRVRLLLNYYSLALPAALFWVFQGDLFLYAMDPVRRPLTLALWPLGQSLAILPALVGTLRNWPRWLLALLHAGWICVIAGVTVFRSP